METHCCPLLFLMRSTSDPVKNPQITAEISEDTCTGLYISKR